MADFCIEKKVAAAPGKDWVLAFGNSSRSFPVAYNEIKAIEVFNAEAKRSSLSLRLVTWIGKGMQAQKTVLCTA